MLVHIKDLNGGCRLLVFKRARSTRKLWATKAGQWRGSCTLNRPQCPGRTRVGLPEVGTGRPLIGSSDYKENVDAHEGWRAQTQTHRKGRAPLRTLLFLRKVFLWTTLVQWSLWVKVAQKQSLQVESNTYPRCLQRPGLKHLRFTFLLEACIVPSHNSYSYYW